MGALSWQKIARILTLQFLEVSAGPTLVDFCHLRDCGPCCSAASRPKDPLRHSMLMSMAACGVLASYEYSQKVKMME